jgi:hypothetical protein
MKIVFDNADFTESLDIGFKGKHQLSFITVVKEYRDKEGNHIDAEMIWSTYDLTRPFRRLFKTRIRYRGRPWQWFIFKPLHGHGYRAFWFGPFKITVRN